MIKVQLASGTPRVATPTEIQQLRTDLGLDASAITAEIETKVAAAVATLPPAGVQAGPLAPSATVAPNASAVQTAIAASAGTDTIARTAAAAAQSTANSKAALQTGGLVSDATKAPNAADVLAELTPARVASGGVVNMNRRAGIFSPIDPSARTLINVAAARTIGARIDGGVHVETLRIAASFDISEFTRAGPVPEGDCQITYLSIGTSKPLAIVINENAVDLAKPLIGNPTVGGAGNYIAFAVTEPNSPAVNAVASGITITGADAAGRTIAGVTLVGLELRAAITPALVYGSVISAAVAAGMLIDSSGNLSDAVLSTMVTNNIALAAPGVPTITAGASASSEVSGTIAAGSGPVPVSFTLFYRTGAAAYATGTTVAYAGASTPFSITGLAASTSFDVKAQANNAAGSSADSGVMTSSTAAAPGGALVSTEVVQAPLYQGFGNIDLSTNPVAAVDWVYLRQGHRKATGAGALTYTPVNSSYATTGAFGLFSYAAGDTAGGVGSAGSNEGLKAFQITAGPSGHSGTAPAGIVERTLRIFMNYHSEPTSAPPEPNVLTLQTSLSDGSATAINRQLVSQDNYSDAYVDITYRAASAGQTLSWSITQATNARVLAVVVLALK